MSLTSFVYEADVKARIKVLRPKGPRTLKLPVKIPPRGNRNPLVGTAFDYLLRFELQRRAPHAESSPWLAEATESWWTNSSGQMVSSLGGAAFDASSAPGETENRCATVLAHARSAHREYVELADPSRSTQLNLAEHAIKLAQLDYVFRAHLLDPTFDESEPELAQELVELLEVAPYEQLVTKQPMLLNPSFGQASLDVGGADADLIAGDLLVDFKTTKDASIEVRALDQLIGYFLLARRAHSFDPKFPVIRRLGIYFSRHGHLWSFTTAEMTNLSEFADIERWFFERAKQKPSNTIHGD